MLILYALKCNEGYIRTDSMQGCKIVSLEKATIFNKEALKDIDRLLQQANRNGANNIRLVELRIIEKTIIIYDQIESF